MMRIDLCPFTREPAHISFKGRSKREKTKERAKSLVGLDREGNQESSG